MKTARFNLFYLTDEEGRLNIYCEVNEKGRIGKRHLFTTKEDVKKYNIIERARHGWKMRMRNNDKGWVRNYIPSSIWWHCEIHHDWKNGGVMYLLDPSRHLQITRKERGYI